MEDGLSLQIPGSRNVKRMIGSLCWIRQKALDLTSYEEDQDQGQARTC